MAFARSPSDMGKAEGFLGCRNWALPNNPKPNPRLSKPRAASRLDDYLDDLEDSTRPQGVDHREVQRPEAVEGREGGTLLREVEEPVLGLQKNYWEPRKKRTEENH